jgi:hypothetical protein
MTDGEAQEYLMHSLNAAPDDFYKVASHDRW